MQTSLWDVSQQWADELLDVEARARELVVRRYTCVKTKDVNLWPLTPFAVLCHHDFSRPCLRRRNVKAESLEFEQVQELFEIRPEEDATYAADWAANRQRALGLVSHIVDSASPSSSM